MTVTVTCYVVVKSYLGVLSKVGVFEDLGEARFALDYAIDEFTEEHYGESGFKIQENDSRYNLSVVDEAGKQRTAAFAIIEI
jgi:hypothetical protein